MHYHFVICYITLAYWLCRHRYIARIRVLITGTLLSVSGSGKLLLASPALSFLVLGPVGLMAGSFFFFLLLEDSRSHADRLTLLSASVHRFVAK
jgi:hypothetical protein